MHFYLDITAIVPTHVLVWHARKGLKLKSYTTCTERGPNYRP